MLTIPGVSRIDALEALIAVAAPFAAPTVHLYKSEVTPSALLTKADMDAVECDFSGYAASGAITWGAAHYDVNYNAIVLGGLVPFLCTDDVDPQDAYGYYLVSGGLLIGMEPFAVLQPARKNLDYIPVIPQMSYGQ
jgi:hypothetical protein